MAAVFEPEKADPVALKAFVNNELAECWEDLSGQVNGSEIAKRRENFSLRTIPRGCLVLAGSVDVQGNRLEYQILGFGRNKKHWVIDYGVIDGDPAKDDVWNRLTALRERPIANTFGVSMRAQTWGIDSGGHHTHEVYQYARLYRHAGVFAIKGSSVSSKPVIGRPTSQDVNHRGRTIKGGVQLWIVGTDTAKSILFNYIASDEESVPIDRFIRFPIDLPEEYFEQLTAEVYDPTKKLWRKLPGRRNEVIDLFVYNFAAAYHPLLRLDTMRDSDWANVEAVVEPVNADLFNTSAATVEAVVQTPAQTKPAAAPQAQAPRPKAERLDPPDDDWLGGCEVNL